MMPTGFFPAVEPDSPVFPILDRLRPAVQAELARHDGTDVTVQAELRVAHMPTGEVELERFYWSTQRADPSSQWGFGARTLYAARGADKLQLHEFPSEPVLTWLGDHRGPLFRDGPAERVEILRYIPLRRVTYRLHDAAGLPASVIAKTKRPGGLNRAAAAFRAVEEAASARAASMPRVPRLLRVDPARHVLYLQELPGDPLDVALSELDVTGAMERLGTLHRSLQELEVHGVPSRRVAAWLQDASAAAERIGLFVPSVGGQARALYAELERTAPEDGPQMFCQGDFLPGQILCHESGWSVIDFDDSRTADPLSEVAAMYAAMPRVLGLAPEQAEQARRTYLEAYAFRAGETIDPDRWRWFQALLELNELGKRLMKGRVAVGDAGSILDRLSANDSGGPG